MKKILLLYSFLFSLTCTAQELPHSTQQQLENLGNEDLEDDALLQQLEYYRKHPVNLNMATLEELQQLRFLSDLQIASLIKHRHLFGKLIDIYELQAIPTFDLLTIQRIRAYVYVGHAVSLKETFLSRFRGGDQYVLFRLSQVLEKSKGYNASLNTHYLGDRNHLLFRYRYQYKNLLYFGLVADKDAGEQFFKGAQKLGFDFYSVHFFARNLGKIKALALGDYTINLGQGLTQWQSLGFGKSVDVINIKRQSPVVLPYRSSGEFYFNRGIAATLGFNKVEATVFVSYKKISGNLTTDTVDRFTSFGTSGYYRTASEIADRNKISDLSFGGSLCFKKGSFKVGANAVTHQYSLPMEKSDEPYNYFAFRGKKSFNGSFDYGFTYRNAHVFGEIAVDKNLHRAMVHGLLLNVDRKVDLSFAYRNFSKGYQSLYGNAFSENSLPSNEKGVFSGVLIRPKTGWLLAAYVDLYRFDFLKYRVSSPTTGCDYMVLLGFTPDKKTEFYLRYRTETKPLDGVNTDRVMDFPAPRPRQTLRVHFGTQINKMISAKGRAEMLWYEGNDQRQEGFLTYIEAAGQPTAKLQASLRLQYFETGGYDSRIYAYESDVLYGYSIPAFYDKGFRYYLNLRYAIFQKLTFWTRLAQTIYQQKETVGSGLDELEGNKKTEIKFQLKYEF